MAATAAPRTTRARKPKPPSVTPGDFLRITQFLDTRVLVERALELRILTLGLLSGVNVHLLGPPGVAKSLGLREFAKCIDGARYFEKALNAGLPEDAVIGGYDMPLFVATGDFQRKVAGKLPDAHLGFLDEWFRANGPMLDSLLPIANTEERLAEVDGTPVQAPLLALVSASNHMPDADNEQAAALVDRITLMSLVERVRSDDSFMEMIDRHHARRLAVANDAWERETVSLAQVIAAQLQVNAVRPTPEFKEHAAKLRRDAITEGLDVSDRRWLELYRVCRANAWMSGRDHLIPEDLAVTEHGMWRDPDHRGTAHKLVLPFHGRYEREATAKREEAAGPIAAFEAIRPLVEGTPPSEDLERDVLTKAISASRNIAGVKARVDAVLEEAAREKRDAATLRDLSNELHAVQLWFKANKLPHHMD
jgi:MoxR-like ATPase